MDNPSCSSPAWVAPGVAYNWTRAISSKLFYRRVYKQAVRQSCRCTARILKKTRQKETSIRRIWGGDWQMTHSIQEFVLKTVWSFFTQLQLLFSLGERQRGHVNPSFERGGGYWVFCCLKDCSFPSSPEPHFMSMQLVTKNIKLSKNFMKNKMKRRLLSYDFVEIQRKLGTLPCLPALSPIQKLKTTKEKQNGMKSSGSSLAIHLSWEE